MKQDSNALPTEGSQVSRRTRLPRFVPAAATAAVPGASMSQLLTLSHPRIPFYQRMGWFLTAALVLSFLSAFTSASSAHASGGGFCVNYNNTWSYDGQAIPSTTRPIMYSGGEGGPHVGLGLDRCQRDQYGAIFITIQSNQVCLDNGCNSVSYQVDWYQPAAGWQVLGVFPLRTNERTDVILSPALSGTYYYVGIKECFNGRCDTAPWSPTVGITT